MQVETRQGSATDPRQNAGVGVIIVNLCNTKGRWGGAGFIRAIDTLSPVPSCSYRQLARDYGSYAARIDADIPLGTQRLIQVLDGVFVVNMVAQEKTLDNSAFKECLRDIFDMAVRLNCDVHLAAGMGSGRAGGDITFIRDTVDELAKCNAVIRMEQRMNFSPHVVWWEYTDQTPVTSPTTSDSVVAATQQAADTCANGLDLSDNDDDSLLL